jgi:hypothetical protein
VEDFAELGGAHGTRTITRVARCAKHAAA